MEITSALASDACDNVWAYTCTVLGTVPGTQHELSKCGCYYYWLLLLLNIRFHGNKTAVKDAKRLKRLHIFPYTPLFPSCQYHYLKNEEMATGSSYPKSLIKEIPFVNSKDGWTDIQGAKLHGGCDDGWPTDCLSIAKNHSDSPHVGSCIRPLENVPGHKPHGITNISCFSRDLIFYLGKKMEELLLAMVVGPTNEIAGVWVIGDYTNSCSYRAIIFPDVKVIDNRSDGVPHFIKFLFCDTVGLVQSKYQLCWIRWTLFYKNKKQEVLSYFTGSKAFPTPFTPVTLVYREV